MGRGRKSILAKQLIMGTAVIKPKTNFSKIKVEGEMSNAWMRERLEMSLLDYNTVIYDLGIEFLTQLYPDQRFEPSFSTIERKASFWKWWRREFDIELQDLIQFSLNHDVCITPEIFVNEMRQLAHYSRTEESFNQYLKIFARC
jgi:hypothetical protein